MFECFLNDKNYSGSSVIVTLFCFLEKINLMIINYCIQENFAFSYLLNNEFRKFGEIFLPYAENKNSLLEDARKSFSLKGSNDYKAANE